MSIHGQRLPFHRTDSGGHLQKVHDDAYAPDVALLAVLVGIDNLWCCQISRNKIVLIIQ